MLTCSTLTVWGTDYSTMLELRQQVLLTMLTVAGQAMEDPNAIDYLEDAEVSTLMQPCGGPNCFTIVSVNEQGEAVMIDSFPCIEQAVKDGKAHTTWVANTFDLG